MGGGNGANQVGVVQQDSFLQAGKSERASVFNYFLDW